MADTDPISPLFGRVLTAMVTPFNADGSVDYEEAALLAQHLAAHGSDGLVVAGTTGESPTLTTDEKIRLFHAVRAAVGKEVKVLAGTGSNNTAETIVLSREAQHLGVDGLLVVTPYYSRPPQSGVLAHFRAVADSADLPVMLYDIPKRSGVPIDTETLLALAEHDRIVGVKDAKGDLIASSQVIAETELEFWAGDDAALLPMLSVGGVGVVGTSTHFCGRETKQLIEAFLRGDSAEALRVHQQLLPIFTGIFRTAGTILTKAGLRERGLDVGGVRLPLVDATDHELSHLRQDLAAAGL